MQFRFFFKQMDVSPTLQTTAQTKVNDRIEKYVTKPTEALITFIVEGNDQKIHCSLKGGDGFSLEVEAYAADMYSAIDLMADKLAVQLKKQKEKIKHHKGNATVRHISEGSPRPASRQASPDYVDAEDILKYEAARRKRAAR